MAEAPLPAGLRSRLEALRAEFLDRLAGGDKLELAFLAALADVVTVLDHLPVEGEADEDSG